MMGQTEIERLERVLRKARQKVFQSNGDFYGRVIEKCKCLLSGTFDSAWREYLEHRHSYLND